ncbi:MAG TPA: DUF1592 domain-containing protein [Opitutaceae bacterium]|nr:DUF1592 domain-containing protein [Opitutaceae bacterium]
MRKSFALLVVAPLAACLVALGWFALRPPPPVVPPPAPGHFGQLVDARFHSTVHPFIETYCVSCHGGKKPKAELDLGSYATLDSIRRDPRRWSLIADRIKAGEMPPDDAEKQPTEAEKKPIVGWIRTVAAQEAMRHADDPGIVLARRLSNAEYDYTIRDLTGVDIRPTKEFPVDPANEAGFDNSGESLAMSPALVKKYLDAARLVADHVVFTPDGLSFAPYPVTTFEDRDKYATNRIIDFYRRQGVSIATRFDNYMAQSLDYADYAAAAWRFQHRAELGRGGATLADFAADAKLSPKYLATLWTTLTTPGGDAGPIAALQARWKNLPAPAAGQEPAALRDDCVALRDFILNTRALVRMKFQNLVPNSRIVADGSQTMVLWKDRQFAENRTHYAGNALTLDWAKTVETDPAMAIPTAEAARARYEESFTRFCAVFPDAFVVYERARMFLTSQKDILSDLSGHRYLTAGFHSQMGYFRDDRPLYDLVLDAGQQRELDRLWAEFNFSTQTPIRQMKGFIWFETAEPPSIMFDPVFADFRAADDELLSEPKLKRLAEVYYSRAENTRVTLPPAGVSGATPLNYRAPAPGTPVDIPPGYTEFKLDAAMLGAIRDYFTDMNARIRALEQAQRAAEPLQLKALLAFAERASRRPLAPAEAESLLAFYRSLRAEKLTHEDAVREAIVSVLMSPAFTFRVDLPNPGGPVARNGVQPLSDYELASRLSYFLWSSLPDQELMAHAAAGDLHRPDVLLAQAHRMAKDERVRGFATEFAGNWLDIRRFEEHNAVDRERFPAFTNELREAMFEEPIRFTEDLVQHNGSVLEFIYGKYTFVNATLAKHYGMPAPAAAADWVRVDDADKYQRGGLLPMAAFLTKNAPGLRTSPVKRGHWVVTKLLGERIPAPPPNVPVLPTDETKLGDLTLRQTLARHRQDKSCASCHNKFDAMGLVFEGFGPVGEVRTTDLAGRPTETSAVFPDGSEGAGLAGLQTYFRTKVQPEFVENLCRKLLAYALGRTLLPSDDPVVAGMIRQLAADGYRFDTLIDRIVTSPQFLHKRVSPDFANN